MSDFPRGGAPKNFAGGRYEVIRVLGTGGTATVYLVRDTSLDVLRALKVLRVGNADLGRRLAAEARMMANLDNPHILRVVDVGEDTGRPYIVTDYLSGGTLADIGEEGPLGVRAALSWMLQVLAALSAAHEVGIVHRDVKPSNVLLDANGVASLADFGIAMRDGSDEERSTRTGVAMGTLAFMAPEQRLDARSVSRAADVYAVGSSLYSLLTYRNAMDLFVVQPGDKRMRGVPPELEAILLKATRYEEDERYDSAAEMADDLWAVLPGASSEPLFEILDSDMPPAPVRTATPGPLASRIRPAADVTRRAMQTLVRPGAGGSNLTLIPPSDPLPDLPLREQPTPTAAATEASNTRSPWVFAGIGAGLAALGLSVSVFVCQGQGGGGEMLTEPPSEAHLVSPAPVEANDAVADIDAGSDLDSEGDTDSDTAPPDTAPAPVPEVAPQPAQPRPAAVVVSPPQPVEPDPVEPVVTGPFPVGHYVGYLNSRPVDMRMTGTPGSLQVEITTWFSEADRSNRTENRQSRAMSGVWEAAADTLRLTDLGEFAGAGTIDAQWTGRAFSGRFQSHNGSHITTFEARPR